MAVDCARLIVPWDCQAPGQALLLCGRLEKIRAAVALCDPREAVGGDDAGARSRVVESDAVRRRCPRPGVTGTPRRRVNHSRHIALFRCHNEGSRADVTIRGDCMSFRIESVLIRIRPRPRTKSVPVHVHRWLLTLVLALVVGVVTPAAARADGMIIPFYGVNFGGNSGQPIANAIDAKRFDWGVSLAFMGAGVLGIEADIARSPDFYGRTDVGGSSVLTATGNLLFGIPIGGQSGVGFRPYALVGLGGARSPGDAFRD